MAEAYPDLCDNADGPLPSASHSSTPHTNIWPKPQLEPEPQCWQKHTTMTIPWTRSTRPPGPTWDAQSHPGPKVRNTINPAHEPCSDPGGPQATGTFPEKSPVPPSRRPDAHVHPESERPTPTVRSTGPARNPTVTHAGAWATQARTQANRLSIPLPLLTKPHSPLNPGPAVPQVPENLNDDIPPPLSLLRGCTTLRPFPGLKVSSVCPGRQPHESISTSPKLRVAAEAPALQRGSTSQQIWAVRTRVDTHTPQGGTAWHTICVCAYSQDQRHTHALIAHRQKMSTGTCTQVNVIHAHVRTRTGSLG